MKIAILGTKGIPNNYGGFEQFAEYLSVGLVKLGHNVTVYNPTFHPYQESVYQGVKLVKIWSPEKVLGGAANFIYDHLCLSHALKQHYDVIYEAGYHSVALSYWLLNVKNKKSPVLITNMDGLEWKRSKWNLLIKKLIKQLEKVAVANSHYLISDNVGIQQYYKNIFKKESFYLPYGAEIPSQFDESLITKHNVVPYEYFLAIARLEPENNVETVIQGFNDSKKSKKLLIIGNFKTPYGRLLHQKYSSDRVIFVGAIYNKPEIDALRCFSSGYFHGHSVGGTNPSLLEAMGSGCFIMAHDNSFNRAILDDCGCYFKGKEDIAIWINNIDHERKTKGDQYIKMNLTKIETQFSWGEITKNHEILFNKLIEK